MNMELSTPTHHKTKLHQQLQSLQTKHNQNPTHTNRNLLLILV
jgi:hypothetical protein